MRRDMQKTIEEIKSEKKIPKELKNGTRKKVLCNFLMAIAILLYFIFLILGSKNSIKNMRAIDFNIFSLILLGITILLFEKAYRKDNGALALHGIEILIVALVTLFFTYIVFELNKTQKMYFYMIGVYFSIYYIVKSIIIGIKSKKIYKQAKIENIKEIIEPTTAEKRESSRKRKKSKKEEEYNNGIIDLLEVVDDERMDKKLFKEIKVIEKNKKEKTKKEEQKEKIKNKEIKENKTLDKKTKKIDTNKKEQEEQEEQEKKTVIQNNIKPTKKRGRPKKTEDIKEEKTLETEIANNNQSIKKVDTTKADKKEIIEQKNSVQPPKKRGRPKKTEDIKGEKTLETEIANNNQPIKKADTTKADKKEIIEQKNSVQPPKKRGRPKKVTEETKDKEVSNLKTEQDAPKKRGRPRKVVS